MLLSRQTSPSTNAQSSGWMLPTARTIAALVLREMSSTYGRTPGGYIWAVLEPIAMIILLSLAFSLIVRVPSLGTSFVMFYATGYLPFSLYTSTATKTANGLRFSQSLLSYPSVLWIDAILSRFVLNFLTNAMVFCIVMIGIAGFSTSRMSVDILPIVTGIGLAACLGLGIGMVNCLLGGLYPIWHNFWAILSRPLFLASGVLFIYEDLPRVAQDIMWWNPLLHITALVRMGFYATYRPDFISLTYTLGFGLLLILVGLIFIPPNFQKILEK